MVVLVLILGYLAFKPKTDSVTITPISTEQTNPSNSSTTYTYSNHGFAIEFPRGYTPQEIAGETGPTTSIELPNKKSWLIYVSDATWWEKYNITGQTTYIRDEKIGATTFKVYKNTGHDEEFYWYRQGNVAYIFNGDAREYMKTFKFTGWTQNNTTSWTKSTKFGLYYPANFAAPTEYYRARTEIVYTPSPITAPELSLVFPDGRAGITWGGYLGNDKATCTATNFETFEYGVSSGACIKGYRASIGHFSARDTVSAEELKIFGDFVLKNQ